MKIRVLISLALGFSVAARAAAPLHSNQAPFDRAAYTIAHNKFVLPNGLTLLVHEDHNAPVVAVDMWYHVGSRNEKRGKTGFAHLFEHFFFNGSENYPHGFREAMDDLGANNRNGTTNTDRTNFFEDVPVSALERTLFLESDRMGFLANYISKEMLERERGVVHNEKRQGENQPYERVRNEVSAKMYPYSWSTIGAAAGGGLAQVHPFRRRHLAGDRRPAQDRKRRAFARLGRRHRARRRRQSLDPLILLSTGRRPAVVGVRYCINIQ
ncbi:M16 family metallopeptidase [Massilia sp. TWR1-2-2]|uniref:M16 family metallopeptidase n=1 Tax=Massilia sp. TWR1-2-2 TaxID=2804584 RepID=UPI003CEBCAF1